MSFVFFAIVLTVFLSLWLWNIRATRKEAEASRRYKAVKKTRYRID